MYSLAPIGVGRAIGESVMLKHRIASVLALFFVVFAQSAQAFFDPPWITPAAPMAGDTVSVNIHGGICDAIFEAQGYPQITQQGNAIRFRNYGVHYQPGDELCIYGIGTATLPIGTFAPGNYTLTVDLAYIDGFGTPSIFIIGVVPFTVTGAAVSAAPVPATGPLALFVLILVLAGMACAMRNRHLGVLSIVLAWASLVQSR